MKKITAAMIISLVLCTFLSVFSNANEVEAMTDKLIRIHIIANSDSESDQELKLKIRDRVLSEAAELFDSNTEKSEAIKLIAENINKIQKAAENEINENGFDYGVFCSLSKEEFGERVYDDFTLPAGDYDSLCIRIGEANGKNWWCVCYPNLCVGTALKIDDCGAFTEGELTIVKQPEKVRYKFWCFEMVQKIKRLMAAPRN